MPVAAFIESTKDFTEADKEKRDILGLYQEDIRERLPHFADWIQDRERGKRIRKKNMI